MKNNQINYYYKQPKYMDKFYCIGGECPETCCAKWTINWTADEIEKLMNDCSDELRERIKTSFTVSNVERKILAVKLDEDGRCPFLTGDNLCMIQKEMGQEYLSYTCRTYPRLITYLDNNYFFNVASASCYKVIDLIYSDNSSMDMVIKKIDNNNSGIKCKTITEDEIKQSPELKYLNEIVDFFYDVLSNKKRSIESSIVIGALAAKKLTQLIEDGKTDSIPSILKKLKPQTEDGKQVESIENIKPNYNFSIGVINEILEKCYGKEIMNVMYTDDIPDLDKFLSGRYYFTKAFEGSMIEKNIILNVFLELFTHKYKTEFTLFEKYMYFVFSASAIKLAGAAVGYVTDNIKNEYKRYISLYMRKLDSNSKTMSDVISILKEHKIDTPAYLALMMKY